MNRPVGIETEYGMLCASSTQAVDFAYEAAMLVRSAPLEECFRGWDYTAEDPRLDLRGSRVDRLDQDPHDLRDSNAKSKQLSRQELLADTVLANGARFYNDHNHPEYCTDACLSLHDLVAQDKAGERVVFRAQQARNAAIGNDSHVRLVKNNSDYHGRSYGCHENYLVKPRRAVELPGLRPVFPFSLRVRSMRARAKQRLRRQPAARAAFRLASGQTSSKPTSASTLRPSARFSIRATSPMPIRRNTAACTSSSAMPIALSTPRHSAWEPWP